MILSTPRTGKVRSLVSDIRLRLRRDRRRGTRIPGALDTADAREREIVDRALPHTMVSPERVLACIDSVDHVTRKGIPGALVECGVWRGGCVLAMILALQSHGVSDRDIYLFDTFEGMTPPKEMDVSRFSGDAVQEWAEASARGARPWEGYFSANVFTLEDVQQRIFATGYPGDRLHFVRGKVEDTVPEQAPEPIALLRLDTDWYESTRHELEHLYPRLSSGGVLMLDDYGHWEGCRRAVDEYFSADPILLARIDYTGRLAVKP